MFESDFRLNFADKYSWLQLSEVVVNKNLGVCTITFLYPSTCQELSAEEKKEIINWTKNYLELEHVDVKVKFKRVFVEEKLILKSILNFISSKYKLIDTYLNENNFAITITNIDVLVEIKVSERIEKYFLENKVVSELTTFLEENYLTNFSITLKVDNEIVDDVDIENVEYKTAYKPSTRYNVEVIKEIVGKDIFTNPQYITNVKCPCEKVIVAGFISKLARKDYIAKAGKSEGQQKTFFSFVLEDEKGKIDCIYFSSKPNVQVMESLEDYMYVVVQGEVELSKYTGRAQLKVKKMALASKEIETPEDYVASEDHTLKVVKTENLTTLMQGDMFADTKRYDDRINGKTYVVFDIETTGLDVSNDQIIELGAVKVVDGKFTEKFQSFVRPTIDIPLKVRKLTGITADMVADAPDVEVVLKDFFEFTRDAIICGHNAIDFDMVFVKRIGKEYGITFDNEIVDTWALARQKHLKVSNFKLGTLVKYFGLTLEGAHRAWNDAYATAEVLLKLCEEN